MKTPSDSDERMLRALTKVFVGKPIDEIIPVLIVASARALVIEADGDEERLETLGERFCNMMQETAEDMLAKGKVH